jgi:uncharacterized membrane protein YjjP (DUF1212 family)
VTQPNDRTHPLIAAAFAVFVAGGIAWLWTGQWRWMVTAVGVAVVIALASGVVSKAAKPPSG